VRRQALGGALGVDFGEGGGELAADGDPFAGLEVVVLEEEGEGGGVQQRGVLAQQLGFAELRRLEGLGLGGRLLGFQLRDGGELGDGCIVSREEGRCGALGAQDGGDHLRGWL
jgi:hypothetical protein